jgi:hypothetical protein
MDGYSEDDLTRIIKDRFSSLSFSKESFVMDYKSLGFTSFEAPYFVSTF